jgi:hypothetical protein
VLYHAPINAILRFAMIHVMHSITSYSTVTCGDNFAQVSLAQIPFQAFGNGVNNNVAPIYSAGLAQLAL